MGTVTIDLKHYGRLLAKTTPRAITNAEEHERALGLVESLIAKGEAKMTPEEDELLDLLTDLIRSYETKRYPARPKSTPREMVAFLLEQRKIAAKDLWPVIGSKGHVSEILAGARGISKAQARKLADFFHVSADLFI